MFDTNLVVVGNVLTAPEWRRIASSGALVANFRVASTARRYDRENSRWVDGNNLRVRVVAWRKLAEGIASSITVGDPVIVQGRLYTRDWKDDNGNPRISFEMEAYAIGHDLARGRAKFFRAKSLPGTGQLEDGESEALIGGEPTVAVREGEAVVGYGDGVPDEQEPTFAEPVPVPALTPSRTAEPEVVAAGGAKPDDEDDLTLEVERLVAEQPAGTRRTRRSKREPVAA
ncbi:single-stranded DNA-binding protein [Actinoplanes sp. CA-030573]|uniref:single-stranded DNA-binding protein n=1 Tax=Actinoplanes sp. CA-030573 TaxID=3239898 RepID=UPI003D938985